MPSLNGLVIKLLFSPFSNPIFPHHLLPLHFESLFFIKLMSDFRFLRRLLLNPFFLLRKDNLLFGILDSFVFSEELTVWLNNLQSVIFLHVSGNGTLLLNMTIIFINQSRIFQHDYFQNFLDLLAY